MVLLVNILGLYISWYRLLSVVFSEIPQTTDIILELPTDRHLLLLSNSCLYMVRLGLGPFLLEVPKIVRTYVYLKNKPKAIQPHFVPHIHHISYSDFILFSNMFHIKFMEQNHC